MSTPMDQWVERHEEAWEGLTAFQSFEMFWKEMGSWPDWKDAWKAARQVISQKIQIEKSKVTPNEVLVYKQMLEDAGQELKKLKEKVEFLENDKKVLAGLNSQLSEQIKEAMQEKEEVEEKHEEEIPSSKIEGDIEIVKGIGPKTAKKLKEAGIGTIAAWLKASKEEMIKAVGILAAGKLEKLRKEHYDK